MFGRKGLTPGGNAPRPAPQPRPQSTALGAAPVPEPLTAGVTYVACVSPGTPFYVEALHSMKPSAGPSEQLGLCFVFEASDGRMGKAFLFGDFASVWVAGEADPRAQIQTEMIDNRVAGYRATLEAMIAGVRARMARAVA